MKADLAAFGVAGSLAALAGATDIYGLSRLHDLFVSFMSGNTTMLGLALGEGDLARAGTAAELVALFVTGAALGAILAVLAGRHHPSFVSFAVAALLVVPVVLPGWTAQALVIAMGALNAAVTRVGQATVSLTYVTGTLVRFGQGFGRWICGVEPGFEWLVQGAMWICLLTGAAGGALMQRWTGTQAMWPLPAFALVVALVTAAAGRRWLTPTSGA